MRAPATANASVRVHPDHEKSKEPTLLGATAAQVFTDLKQGMPKLSKPGKTCMPASGTLQQLHDRRYEAFCTLLGKHKIHAESD